MSLNESGRYSREFMVKAVERLEAGERTSALALELSLNRTIIYHWRDRFRANGAEALTSKRGRPRTPEVLAAQSARASRARADGLVQAIETTYNRQRLHSALAYLSPVDLAYLSPVKFESKQPRAVRDYLSHQRGSVQSLRPWIAASLRSSQ